MIYRGLLRKELVENRWKYLVMLVYLTLFGASLYLLFQWIGSMIMETLYNLGIIELEFIRKLIGQQLEDFSFFAWANWYGKNFYQSLVVFAIILGMSNIAGETGRGTASFLFTKPLSRKTIFLTKYVAGATGIAIVIIIPTVVAVLVSQIYGEPLSARFLLGIPLAYAGTMVIYSITVLFSSIFDDQIKAAAGAILVALVISIPSWISSIRFLSIYALMQGWPVYFGEGGWLLPVIAMLLSSGIICWFSLQQLEKKDFN